MLKLRVKCLLFELTSLYLTVTSSLTDIMFYVAVSNSCPLCPSDRCDNVQAADIVFLVDGSSSIGRPNFLQVKGFMAGIVKPFAGSVGESGIRFGVAQYSDTSR